MRTFFLQAKNRFGSWQFSSSTTWRRCLIPLHPNYLRSRKKFINNNETCSDCSQRTDNLYTCVQSFCYWLRQPQEATQQQFQEISKTVNQQSNATPVQCFRENLHSHSTSINHRSWVMDKLKNLNSPKVFCEFSENSTIIVVNWKECRRLSLSLLC